MIRPMKNPPHIGAFIRTEIIEALGLSVTNAANRLQVSRQTLNNLLNQHAALTPRMALKIEKHLGGKADHLMRMQLIRDMTHARRSFNG